MSERSVIQPVAMEEETIPPAAAVPENVLPTGESGGNELPQMQAVESFKTLELLKEWQIVPYILKRGQDAYKYVKHCTKITETSLNITEKVVTTLMACSPNIIKNMTPVLKLVDYPASEGLVRLQKRFPVVKESPEKIYDTAVEPLVKLISPAVNKAVMITSIGRKQVGKAIRIAVKTCHKTITLLGDHLEQFEDLVSATKHEMGSQPETSPSTCGSRLRGAARRALGASVSLMLFWLGAYFWVLERLPLVGRLLAEVPYTLQTLSPPSRPRRRSTDSIYVSLSDLRTADDCQRSPLATELSQATQ